MKKLLDSAHENMVKVRWQIFGYFNHLINVDKNSTFLDHLPPYSCKRSLRKAPNILGGYG